MLARQVREQLDRLGATQTRIVVSAILTSSPSPRWARAGRQLRCRHRAGYRVARRQPT
ncbi:nicotinate phosphoribosyltransferase domain protein [Mycobacterium xenopi 4042]|uniref:Nicotinate phosphoribosyltransferase domain protein n=1 Tax=Mycobacterium xenopi 4042 TaxID=1299334 RepID=X8CLM9_MYCXE|nr:nicotinate phosphoribosyltransferase domain protein [Mycobacterium xenopi 4042]